MKTENKLNQRPIPEAALDDPDAVEMLRVWVANKGLHCSIKVGMYRETMNIPEEKAWGTILADAARHIANALALEYSENSEESLAKIKNYLIKELEKPTSGIKGGFSKKH
jgi:hypothetical protein